MSVLWFIFGVYILASGSVPSVLVGGSPIYYVPAESSRRVGIWLIIPVWFDLCRLCVIGSLGNLTVFYLALTYAPVVMAIFEVATNRKLLPTGDDGLLVGTKIPAQKAHETEIATLKILRAVFFLALSCFMITAIVAAPLAIVQATQAIKIARQHNLQPHIRIVGHIIQALGFVTTIFGAWVLGMIIVTTDMLRVGIPDLTRLVNSAPLPEARILFVVDGKLRVINPDGSGDHVVANPWSESEGTRLEKIDCVLKDHLVVLSSGLPATYELPIKDVVVVDVDSGQWWRVTDPDPAIEDTMPACSPDGQQIAFYSADILHPSYVNAYVRNIDGSNHRQVTDTRSDEPIMSKGNLAWTPDGRFITYAELDGLYSVEVMVHDGRVPEPQLVNPAVKKFYSWSPDGLEIAFFCGVSNTSYYNLNLCISNADGSKRRVVASNARGDVPVWSPDGNAIAYVAKDSGFVAIHLVNIDGSGQRSLLGNAASNRIDISDINPVWSPDGKWIMFVRESRTESEIYLMSLDGLQPRRLTDGYSAVWLQ